MINHYRGETEVTVGGITRPLRFTFQAIAQIEAALGKKTANDLLMADTLTSAQGIREFFIAGLMCADKKLTREECLQIYDSPMDLSFDELITNIHKALLSSLTNEEIAEDSKKKEDGPGPNSSESRGPQESP